MTKHSLDIKGFRDIIGELPELYFKCPACRGRGHFTHYPRDVVSPIRAGDETYRYPYEYNERCRQGDGEGLILAKDDIQSLKQLVEE